MAGPEGSSRVVLAVVTGAHGIRGEVRLKSFAASLDYGPLERSDGGPPLELLGLRPAKDGLIARFAGVNDRNAAQGLKGVELSVARERLPEPAEDEFYFADLVGLAAERPDGTPLGEVVAVHNFGAGDVIEVQLADGDTVLLPFTRSTVPDVDPASRRLVMTPESRSAAQGRGAARRRRSAAHGPCGAAPGAARHPPRPRQARAAPIPAPPPNARGPPRDHVPSGALSFAGGIATWLCSVPPRATAGFAIPLPPRAVGASGSLPSPAIDSTVLPKK
mgnify:CR=1 FL=1